MRGLRDRKRRRERAEEREKIDRGSIRWRENEKKDREIDS